MAKGSRSSSKSKTAPAKIKKTKNSIHKVKAQSDVVTGPRKRIHTERYLESFSIFPKKIAKKHILNKVPKKKSPLKRLNTMKQTAKEGRKYLKGLAKKRNASKSPKKTDDHENHDSDKDTKASATKSPARNDKNADKHTESASKSAEKHDGSAKKGAKAGKRNASKDEKSRSRSKEKAPMQKKEKKEKKESKSKSKSPRAASVDDKKEKKEAKKSKKSAEEALKDAREILSKIDASTPEKQKGDKGKGKGKGKKDQAHSQSPAPAPVQAPDHGSGKKIKRTKTMADAVQSAKSIVKGVRGRTRSKGKK